MTGVELPLAVLAGIVVGLGLFVAVLALVGMPPRAPGKPSVFRRRQVSSRVTTVRLAWGIGAGILTLVGTRWVIAAVAIGLLAAFWDRIAGSDAVERVGIARLEAMASWTESLRDTIAAVERVMKGFAAEANQFSDFGRFLIEGVGTFAAFLLLAAKGLFLFDEVFELAIDE